MAETVTMKTNEAAQPSKKEPKKKKAHPIFKKMVRHTLIFLISLSIVLGSFYMAGKTAYEKFIMPVDPEDDTMVSVEVPMGTSINGIAKILYEEGLIRNSGAFKLMVDLSNKTNKMKAGKYEISKSMTLNEMINELMTGQVSVSTIQVTIPEGLNIRQIAARLVDMYKMKFTKEQFIAEAKDLEKYEEEFPFLKNIPEERRSLEFPLEGYLFPETYNFYADSSPERIIRTLLSEFDDTFSIEMRDLAEQKDMTIDEVVTLASVIQNEAKLPEFEMVSAVFHNRLSINMRLQADATTKYALKKDTNEITLTAEELATDSPYNTHKVDGLPIGPISSPGKAAMEAVLNPFEEYLKDGEFMLYYVLMDPEVGLHAFNSNYEDHIKDTKKYSANWD